MSQERRCHLCGSSQKPFRTVRAYQAHINSAAHAPKIFYSPLDSLKSRNFATLGGLTQHMESGRCEGGLEMYSKAIAFVEEQLKFLVFSSFMLLSS